jgi:cysteine-rich repeat protein
MRHLILVLTIGGLLIAPGAQAQFQCDPRSENQGGSTPGDYSGCFNTFDCDGPQGPCREDTYGLGNPETHFGAEPDASNPFQFDINSFFDFDTLTGGSFTMSRGTGNQAQPACGAERNYQAMSGKVVLRELENCTPTVEEGCPVEFALSTANGSEAGQEIFYTTATVGFFTEIPFVGNLNFSTAIAGGLSGWGFRFARPQGGTVVRFSELYNGSPRNSFGCCNVDNEQGIGCAPPAAFDGPYPRITEFADSGTTSTNNVPWIFPDGGPGTRFYMDPDFTVENQLWGVCSQDRRFPCTSTGAECANSPLGDVGPCDFRELGWRFQPLDIFKDTTGAQNPERCNQSPFFFAGTPETNCSITAYYGVAPEVGEQPSQEGFGDPGPDCTVRNYGWHWRPDLDCDGIDDTEQGRCHPLGETACAVDADCPSGICVNGGDLCPLYSEVDQFRDSDGDGRGDECRCGDATRDGFVDVSDILGVNTLIFNPPEFPETFRLSAPLCETFAGSLAADDTCNVEDILGVNEDIFNQAITATCGRHPCGDGQIILAQFEEPRGSGNVVNELRAEECDDGNQVSGDGCSATCMLEPGFTCSAPSLDPNAQEPSVCTPN